ncbi:MAG TPA: sulfite exporter TauE/SafE family protein [Rhizomicrobium sp.]|jgi:uncharacterized membrane protein YfcA|nr:sulfite exporter TauE/SafE family protein [Rhizomicrobium sp.]
MDIYLPIAQLSVNWTVILAMGTAAGFLSGMLGVSGGFIMTPLLIFYGIPSGVAVATQASPISAAALVGALAKSARGSVDFKMGFILLLGGVAGSFVGVHIFIYLQRLGQIDLVVELSYVLLLGSVGVIMLAESAQAYLAAKRGAPPAGHTAGQHNWIHNLPFKMRFRASRIYVSAIPIVVLGFLVGVMTAILGTGGAFLLIPAKIYLLRMRTTLAVGTSQFQMCIVAFMTTFIHAATDHTVDIVLGVILILGGVAGAQMGVRLGAKMRSEQLRIVFALLTLAIAAQLVVTLVRKPPDVYTLAMHGATSE